MKGLGAICSWVLKGIAAGRLKDGRDIDGRWCRLLNRLAEKYHEFASRSVPRHLLLFVGNFVRGGRSELSGQELHTIVLADRPSFVPSLVVIGGDEPISGRSGFSSNGWQTNTETARSGGC